MTTIDKKQSILNQLQERFKDCRLHIMDNVIYVRRGNASVTKKPFDLNTLEYLYDTQQLDKHLKEIKEI